MITITTMMASLNSNCVSCKSDHHQHQHQQKLLSDNPFDGFVNNRERTERTLSLALPNNSLLQLYNNSQDQKQNQHNNHQQEHCNSLSLLPANSINNLRRHSSHCCTTVEDKSFINQLLHFQKTSHSNRIPDDHLYQPACPTPAPLIPPPVPKRTFKGKFTLKQNRNENDSITTYSNNFRHQAINQEHQKHNYLQQKLPKSFNRISPIISRKQQQHINVDLMTNDDIGDGNNGTIDMDDDDKMSNFENSVFEEPNCRSNDLYNVLNNSRYSDRSSSDSNKSSHTTTDTGYLSSNDNEKPYTSPSYQIDISLSTSNRNYRSRFSSVDTQSSVDSCLTEKTIDSPLSKDSFKIDSLTSSVGANQNDFSINNQQQSTLTQQLLIHKSPSPISTPLISRNLPTVPARKQQQQQHQQQIANVLSILPSIKSNSNSMNGGGKIRTAPPEPPLRLQQSIDFTTNCYMGNSNSNIVTNNDDPFNAKHQIKYEKNALNTKSITHNKNKPPPIKMHSKFHQRQDSSLSSDSYSMSSSPGYNCKSMEAPLLHYSSKISKTNCNLIKHDLNDNFGMTTSRYNWPSTTKINCRQDSSLSSDSFSQTSSPGCNSKLFEAPLLLQAIKINNAKQMLKAQDEIVKESTEQSLPTSPIIKSVSTPASLQAIVRFQNGSNMSLQHRVLNRRKSSNPYVTQGRLKFRLCQILLNAVALIAIAGGLAAYFNAYPIVRFINKTIETPAKPIIDNHIDIEDKNPAPGVCLPIIVKFCQNSQLPYNYTVFPNYMGHFGQPEAQVVLEAYDALVDVRCYELVTLFLCTLFVPKCGPTGSTVPPCRILCTETMRRCGFFFSVFGLELPDYLTCSLFTDTTDPNGCVGLVQVREARIRALNPVCTGFLCDQKRCIPSDWRCDGHVDCQDQTDESQCNYCGKDSIYCGEKRCMSQKHVCDGIMDCPYEQDERNCIRLSERNGDLGKGTLEVYKSDVKLWAPACVSHWDSSASPAAVCLMLGYSAVNSSRLMMRGSNTTIASTINESPAMWRMYQRKHSNLMKQFSSCPVSGQYPVVELTCTNYECGKIRNKKFRTSRRIVGGSTSNPGDWPFLAAILGGPEEIFYCAGVLIADQWVLTASHCVGNHTLRNINDWTIQLGVTRRYSHTYYGQKVKVLNVIPHPQYNSDIAHDNDIALFQLATRVAFHEHLLPICLPPTYMEEIRPGTLCTVIGWGKKEDKNLNPSAASASYEPSVNEVQVPVLSRDLCNEWLDTPNVTEGMICAGYEDGGKDACQGDSGGPLLCPIPGERDRWFVGGIVSWGIMCAHPKLPGVYANVPKYVPWINEEINRYSNSNFDSNFGR